MNNTQDRIVPPASPPQTQSPLTSSSPPASPSGQSSSPSPSFPCPSISPAYTRATRPNPALTSSHRSLTQLTPSSSIKTTTGSASPAVDKNWDQHINNALLGYTTIPNPKAYNLRPGVEYGPSNSAEIFSISFYHQLHCLAMIRHAYYHPLDPHMHGHDSRSPPSEIAQRTAHLDHCFDYLRQGITCAADMTVEWAKEEVDGSRRQVDGWGIPHRECRDMRKVEAFMERWRIE